jgi:sulfite exporter TauE/SafE
MGPITIGFGLFLIILALVTFIATGSEHLTALIPAGFGVLLAILGALARKDSLRKHVMHAAAALGLIGFVMPAIMVVRRLLNPDPDPSRGPAALIEQSIMALASAVFVGLCVKSFIDARRARDIEDRR